MRSNHPSIQTFAIMLQYETDVNTLTLRCIMNFNESNFKNIFHFTAALRNKRNLLILRNIKFYENWKILFCSAFKKTFKTLFVVYLHHTFFLNYIGTASNIVINTSLKGYTEQLNCTVKTDVHRLHCTVRICSKNWWCVLGLKHTTI